MVEENTAAEQYSVQYASFRSDKAASPGYSAELISNRVDKAFYDDLSNLPNEPNS